MNFTLNTINDTLLPLGYNNTLIVCMITLDTHFAVKDYINYSLKRYSYVYKILGNPIKSYVKDYKG